MDIIKFNELNFDDKVVYINRRLSEGDTVIRIREDIGISEKYLQREMKKHGFKFNPKLRKYDKDNINNIPIVNDDINHTFSIPRFKEDILEILDMKNDLKEIVKAFKDGYDKKHTNVIEVVSKEGIKIDLSDSEIVRTTVRVNKDILDKWNDFCEKNREFSKTNLLSMCMKEYIDKHNKY